MVWLPPTNWQPTRLMEVAGSADTSTGVAEVTTDAGRAYLKALGNRQGPHVLATDWVGTHLAAWFGLSTFDIAILTLTAEDSFPLREHKGTPYTAEPGPAFVARAESGGPWGCSTQELDNLVNPKDITRLIIFDTWTLNCDRHYPDPDSRKPNYDNVYLSSEGVTPGKRRLIAMDHGLCFIRSGEDLTRDLDHIDKVKDGRLYGLFPEFHDRLDQGIIEICVQRLKEMDATIADAMIATVPEQWEVPLEARQAWSGLICRRARYVADSVEEWINRAVPWFGTQGG